MNSSEVAREVGIHASYIGEWRAGQMPTRLQERTRRKIESALQQPIAPSAAYYDGVLFAAQAMSETITRLLAEARAGLQREAPATPTAAEIVAGVAALDAAAPSGAAPRSTRPARSRPA